MAKNSEATEEKTQNNVVPLSGTAGLPAELQDQMGRDAGRGVSTAAEDNIIPLIYILQSNSPQVLKNNSAFIKGASASDIWLRNASPEIVQGDQGILFQPCYFYKEVVEWRPRENSGGFVGRHAAMPENASKYIDPKNPQRVLWRTPDGNDLVETRYHAGLVYGGDFGLKDYPDLIMPYILTFSGTGHTVSRQWMSLMGQFTVGAERRIAPSYARRYRLTTVGKSNSKGDWFAFKVDDSGWVPSTDIYNMGRDIYERFTTGQLKAEAPEGTGDDEAVAEDAAARAGV